MKSIKELFSKNIPTKNYLIVFVVSVLVMVVCLYARVFYLNYKENASSTSVFFEQSINQINTEDLDFALNELTDYYLYVSYTGSEDIYNNERKMLKMIEKKNLVDRIIYWNISDIYDSGEYLSLLKKKFPEVENKINMAPLIIYVKNGIVTDAVGSEFDIVNASDFEKLIDKYATE